MKHAAHRLASLPPYWAFLWNLGVLYLCYFLCRVVYVWEFWDIYSAEWEQLSLWQLLCGAWRFDTSAILYTNVLYTLLAFLPLPRRWTEIRGYLLATKIVYVTVNALMLAINLADTVYSRYTGRRTTWSFFSEFSNEGNLAHIVGIELLHHWYLTLLGLAFIAGLILLYRSPRREHAPLPYYLGRSLALAVCIPLFVIGMRGGASSAVRPITISNANQYVNRPIQADIVLNTPFSLIRTIGKTTFVDPAWFSQETLNALYTPLHTPDSLATPAPFDTRPNIVVLIVESLSAEYMGFYNPYPGFTPFLDSLASQSLTFTESFSNGRKSIDAMPSILSSIPMFVEPFFLTSYSRNYVSGLAGELRGDGYATAFFHGAKNGSMGFEAFARTSGFERYYGRTEYNADPRFGGDDDFDGTWAIWDEEFLQFFAHILDTLPQPFMTALFTASSHHPFRVPERYADSLHVDGLPIYTCIRYTDMALRRFFATASRQPWYHNTLFVITADHPNVSEQPAYSDNLGPHRVPILFFDPSGRLPHGRQTGIAQQIDIMPSVLGAVGYRRPYIAYGFDLLTTPPDSTWALHYFNGIYQYVRGDYLLFFENQRAIGLYHMNSDPRQQHNLLDAPDQHDRVERYTRHVKAIIQSYMQRMIHDQLTADPQPQPSSSSSSVERSPR